MTTVHGIPSEASAGRIELSTFLNGAGAVSLTRDKQGSGWHAAIVSVYGQRGAYLTYLALHSGQLRDLAHKAERTAAFIDARDAGKPGPCLCTAWGHNLDDCPNDAQADATMCGECWPPSGQSVLTMAHGQPAPADGR